MNGDESLSYSCPICKCEDVTIITTASPQFHLCQCLRCRTKFLIDLTDDDRSVVEPGLTQAD